MRRFTGQSLILVITQETRRSGGRRVGARTYKKSGYGRCKVWWDSHDLAKPQTNGSLRDSQSATTLGLNPSVLPTYKGYCDSLCQPIGDPLISL